MYRVGTRGSRKKRRIAWPLVVICILIVGAILAMQAKQRMQPATTIKQAEAATTKVKYESTIKHYDQPDFGVDLPASWKPLPRPAGPYQTFSWQSTVGPQQKLGDQVITIYEDTIPVNFAVNRVLIVEAQDDHMSTSGNVSENCSTFTKNAVAKPNQVGVLAKWQEIDFLCDQANTARNVIGTSSKDGVNTVTLKKPGVGAPAHKFFFTLTDSSIDPDYTVFYNVINSFGMQ